MSLDAKDNAVSTWSGLMAKAQAGDKEAYQDLLQQIYPAIQNFLLKRLGPFGFEEDMTQECLIAIHRAMATFDPEREFKPWMYAIIRNKLIDILRKKQRIYSRELLDNDAHVTNAVDPSYLDNKEVNESVQASLAQLPEEMRQAVELTKIKGLSTKEAAVEADISEAAMRTRISRAYQLMRKTLEQEIGW